MAYSFGSGALFGRRTDVANSTPVNFGLVQSVSIDETATIKQLMGQYQRPVAIARGGVRTTGKATVARISALAFANLFYGTSAVPGQVATAFNEAGAIPAATPYTVTAANSATYAADAGGVVYAATGLPLTKVASAPTVGQYSVSAGVYTFAAADTGKAVLLTYTYTIPTGGLQIPITNQLLGATPTFAMQFYTTFQNQTVNLTLNACTSNKLAFATKLEDFVIPEFDFEAFADAAGNVGAWNFSEAS